MNVYTRGTAINLVQRFWTIDPLTQQGTPGNPTNVLFTLLSPDGTTQTFHYGVDPNVSNPQVGIFICSLDPQLPVGTYRYRCDGTGAIVASSEDMFDVIESGVLTPDQPTVAVTGPCSSWINGDDVADDGPPIDGIASNHFLLDDVAYNASYLLWEASGRQFPGVCTRTVRPCSDGCDHWSIASGMPWYWGYWSGSGVNPATWGWGWGEQAPLCGCGSLSTVNLPGYPVREVVQVKIGGVILPAVDSATSAPNYRLDNRRHLVRMNTPGATSDDATENFWPACQDLALDDDQPGTFSVTYRWGADVPSIGRAAAAQLARELWKVQQGLACALPQKVTKVVRQGVTLERITPLAQLLRSGATGLTLVDLFIGATNPYGMRRRPAVFSPDVQQYARKTGQVGP